MHKTCFIIFWTRRLYSRPPIFPPSLIARGIDPADYEKVLDFLLDYGVLGVKISETEYFIYTVSYDLKVLKIRADRGKDDTRYVVNPAFWPTFGIAA